MPEFNTILPLSNGGRGDSYVDMLLERLRLADVEIARLHKILTESIDRASLAEAVCIALDQNEEWAVVEERLAAWEKVKNGKA